MVVQSGEELARAPLPLAPRASHVLSQTAVEPAPFAGTAKLTTSEMHAEPDKGCTAWERARSFISCRSHAPAHNGTLQVTPKFVNQDRLNSVARTFTRLSVRFSSNGRLFGAPAAPAPAGASWHDGTTARASFPRSLAPGRVRGGVGPGGAGSRGAPPSSAHLPSCPWRRIAWRRTPAAAESAATGRRCIGAPGDDVACLSATGLAWALRTGPTGPVWTGDGLISTVAPIGSESNATSARLGELVVRATCGPRPVEPRSPALGPPGAVGPVGPGPGLRRL